MSKQKKHAEFEKILEKIPDDKKYIGQKLIDELEFMHETLETLREKVKTDGITEQFINGKQQFEREAPALTSYTKVIQRYGTMYKQLTDLMPHTQEAQSSNAVYDFLKED